jgi:hypothetical protein
MLQAEILSQHTPWVGTLTQVHKKIISDKKCIDSDIINQVHSVKGFQNTSFAPQFKTVEQKWISNTIFTDIMGKCTQIHHTGQDHWVTGRF